MLVQISQQWDYGFFLVLPWQPANYMTCQWTIVCLLQNGQMCVRVCIHLHTWAHLAQSVFSISFASSLPLLAFQRITPLAGPFWCLGTPPCIPQHHRGCLHFKNSPCELVQKGRKWFWGLWRGLSVTAMLMLAQLKQLKPSSMIRYSCR